MSGKIDAFLKKNNFEVVGTVKQVEELEKIYNIKFPDELEKLLSALITTKRNIYLYEWSFTAKEITDYSPFKEQNLFEEIVKRDQQNYLGTGMLELFTNSIYLGYLGNGDAYLANFNSLDENKERGVIEVVFFNHETQDLEFVFADSLESFITVNELLEDLKNSTMEFDDIGLMDDDMVAGIIDTEAFTIEMGKLAGKVNLPWHFNELMDITMMEPEYKTVEQAKYLMYRSLWVIYLLKSDSVHNVGSIPEIFALIKHPPINDIDEFIKPVSAQNPVSSIYWLWYFFFFNKEEYLQKFCKALKVVPSPMVQDAIKLVCELQNGRKELGAIKDIHKLREQFLKLDLDPDREEERKKEAKQREIEKKEKDKKDGKKANEIIKNNKLHDLPEIAWKFTDNEIIVNKIFDYLRTNDESFAIDFARFDFLMQGKASRNNLYYDFENKEILSALYDEKSLLSPLLFSNGYIVNSPHAAKIIVNKIKEIMPVDDFTGFQSFKYRNHLQYLQDHELEDVVIDILPEACIPENIIQKMNFENDLKFFASVFGKIKSKKAVPYLLEYIEVYKHMMNDKDKIDAAGAKNSFYDEIAPTIFNALGEIGDYNAIPVLKEFLETPLRNYVLESMIKLGDQDVIPLLKSISDRQLGNPEKTIFTKMLYEYALHMAGKECDASISRFALDVIMAKKDPRDKLHQMAIQVIAKHTPVQGAVGLIEPFLEAEDRDVRLTAIKALKEMGVEVDIEFMDRARVDFIYETKGKEELVKHLKNPHAVFRHNIIRKLVEEKDTNGIEDLVIEYCKMLTRFKYYTNPYVIDKYQKTDYTICALAEMKDRKVDEFIYSLMGHVNVMFRDNDLFKYRNYTHSEYLAELMKFPPEIEQIEEKPASNVSIEKQVYGNVSWLFGVNIYGISFSSDGKKCAVAGAGKASIFDSAGEEIIVLDDSGHAYDVDFSPNGSLVAVGFHGGYLYIYSAQTGKIINKCQGHDGVPNGVRKVHFSSDGKRLASVSDDRTLRIWDVKTANQLKVFDFKFDANTVDCFPEDSKVVVGTDNTIHIIDLNKDKIIKTKDVGPIAEVRIHALNEEIIIAAGGGKVIYLFDSNLKTLNELKQKYVSRVRFSSDNSSLYAVSWDGGVRVWDLKKLKQKKLKGYENSPVYALDINSVNGEIYAGGDERIIQHWNKENENITPESLVHTTEIKAMVYSTKNEALYSVSTDGTVIQWNKDRGGTIIFESEDIGLVESMALSPDEEKLYIGSKGVIISHDLKNGESERIEKEDRSYFVKIVNNKILTSSEGILFYIGGAVSDKALSDSLYKAHVINRNKEIVTHPFLRSEIAIYDKSDLNLKKLFNTPDGIYDSVLTSDEKELYVSCSNQQIIVYSTDNWEVLREIHNRFAVDVISLSPNEEYIAYGYTKLVEIRNTKDISLIASIHIPGTLEKILFINNGYLVCGLNTGIIIGISLKWLEKQQFLV